MKLLTLVASWPALQKLGAMDDLPAKAAYRVAKAIRVARREMEAFEKARLAAVQKHGESNSAVSIAPTGMPTTYTGRVPIVVKHHEQQTLFL